MQADLKPNHIGGVDDPVNLAIMDVDAFVHEHGALPVTSTLTKEPSTNFMHRDGLYSETIFGPIGSPDRMIRFGYIDLNTTIFHPKIFSIICKLKGLYREIMSGSAYATWDPLLKSFERVMGDPLQTEGACTGYSFFMSHYKDMVFSSTSSVKRDERIEVLEQYKDRAFMTRHLVEPAGLRDISNDSSGRLVQDDINKLYISLMMYARSIPKGSQSLLYDAHRFQLQAKAQEIYEYVENFLDGKRGFIQGSFARRKVAMGTRNVITASTFNAASPEDPQLQKTDEVMVGVYQTAKGLQPFFVYAWNKIFRVPIFKAEWATQIALSDPKTGKLVYTEISATTRDVWTSSEGLDKLINSFSNIELRRKPVLIKDVEGKDYALCLVYDEGDTIALCRSIDDLEQRWPRKVNKAKLRPITYFEMFYLITEFISFGKHGIVTRYPVIEQGSSYVAQIHVVSTTPARCVQLVNLLATDGLSFTLKQYPILGANHMDAMMAHPSKLAGMGADHDGDKVSLEYIWSRDGNEECAKYLASPRSVVNTDLRFITGGTTYLGDLTLHCWTHR